MSLAKDKQKEIREGIGEILDRHNDGKGDAYCWCACYEGDMGDEYPKAKIQAIGEILSYLHSQGVVMRVKCPDCEWSQFIGEESVGMTPCYSCNSTGYSIEPLIEE